MKIDKIDRSAIFGIFYSCVVVWIVFSLTIIVIAFFLGEPITKESIIVVFGCVGAVCACGFILGTFMVLTT